MTMLAFGLEKWKKPKGNLMADEIINDTADIINSQNIFNEIERIVQSNKGDYMDAILHYCEKNNVEVETIAKYIKKNVVLKAKIQEEAEELNYLQKTARLPI
jgi:hypothetical protein